MNKRRIAIAVAGVVLIGGSATACFNKAVEPWNDAKIAHKDDSPADVYSMPDGFNNFAEKCDKYGNLVVTVYHADGAYAGVAAIKDGCK